MVPPQYDRWTDGSLRNDTGLNLGKFQFENIELEGREFEDRDFDEMVS